MTRNALRQLEAQTGTDVPAEALEFIRAFGGPVALHQPGTDRSRVRVVVTLLHGNEPSGVRAVHRWLRSARTPTTDVVFLLGAIEAALTEPAFTHRTRIAGPDLNRCFAGSSAGDEGVLARSLLGLIETIRPEALVDIHNNSGHNPAYGVAPLIGRAEQRLTSLFATKLVHYDLHIGSMIELVAQRRPAVVVEVGRAGDPAADQAAWRGLEQFLTREAVIDGSDPTPSLDLLVAPVRVKAAVDLVAYSTRPEPGAELTIAEDIDRHNFESLPAGTVFGWVDAGRPLPLEAYGADGRDRAHDLFVLRHGRLETRETIVPIMMTTDPRIALGDCLFYVVRPAGQT